MKLLSKFERTLASVVTAVLLTAGVAQSAAALSITFDTTFPGRGWFDDQGTHISTIDNTYTGHDSFSAINRSFFNWDISSLAGQTVTSVTFVLTSDGCCGTGISTLDIFDVSATRAQLIADYPTGSAAGQAIYNDLGTGGSYGSFDAQAGAVVAISTALNFLAVADINAAIASGDFSLGLDNPDPFFSPGVRFDGFPQQLIVEVQTQAPVPVPATLALFGLGLAGLGWSRRKKA